jgi:hypothetical protein
MIDDSKLPENELDSTNFHQEEGMKGASDVQHSMKSFFDANSSVEQGQVRQLHMEAQYMLAEYFMMNEAKKHEWRHILLIVGKKTRDSSGVSCNNTMAINMQNDKRINLLIESSLIDSQEVQQIENVLRASGVQLAQRDVSIYLQIAHTKVTSQVDQPMN